MRLAQGPVWRVLANRAADLTPTLERPRSRQGPARDESHAGHAEAGYRGTQARLHDGLKIGPHSQLHIARVAIIAAAIQAISAVIGLVEQVVDVQHGADLVAEGVAGHQASHRKTAFI